MWNSCAIEIETKPPRGETLSWTILDPTIPRYKISFPLYTSTYIFFWMWKGEKSRDLVGQLTLHWPYLTTKLSPWDLLTCFGVSSVMDFPAFYMAMQNKKIFFLRRSVQMSREIFFGCSEEIHCVPSPLLFFLSLIPCWHGKSSASATCSLACLHFDFGGGAFSTDRIKDYL